MYKCKKCGSKNYDWKNIVDEQFKIKITIFKCFNCGYSFSFAKPYKPQPESERAFANYKIKKGKRFLKNNDWNKFKEVGLRTGFHKGKKYIQVVPIEESNLKGGDY